MRAPTHWLNKFESLKSEIGRWGLLLAAYSYLMHSLSGHLVVARIFVRELSPDLEWLPPKEIDVRFATRDELLLAAGDPQMQLDIGFVEAALARGDICAAAFLGASLVAYAWRSFSWAPLGSGLAVEFSKPYRYGYKAYTLPEYRGLRIQEALSSMSDRHCVERGYTRGISYVETHNTPSIHMTQRLGGRCVGFAGYVTLFGRRFPFRSPGVKRQNFAFRRLRAP